MTDTSHRNSERDIQQLQILADFNDNWGRYSNFTALALIRDTKNQIIDKNSALLP